MLYNVTATNQAGVFSLKRDTIEGALKKAGELRREGIYNEVRIIEMATGTVVDESQIGDAATVVG